MSIHLKRSDGGIITSKDDRILFDLIFGSYGLIGGGSATMSAVNQIHIGATRGFIKGTDFIIDETDVAVELSDSGEKNGRLKLVIDYADTESPGKFVSEVASELPELVQDEDINFTNGVYEVVYATYTATETTISNVELVMPQFKSVKDIMGKMDISKISDGTITGAISSVNEALTTSDGTKFRVGKDAAGKLGYIITDEAGADTVVPFSNKPVLVGTYTGNRTLSLETLGYPDATAEDFLVVITNVPATYNMPYYNDLSKYSYYAEIGSTAVAPIIAVSGGQLSVAGMIHNAYFHGKESGVITLDWKTPSVATTWKLYHIG